MSDITICQFGCSSVEGCSGQCDLANHIIMPRDLNGIAALIAAGNTDMCKRKGERDTEFVKRIVCAYLNAHMADQVTSIQSNFRNLVSALAAEKKRTLGNRPRAVNEAEE